MAERLKDIIEIIEGLAPKKTAETWDNVGLQVGGLQDDVSKVLITLDVTEAVLTEAKEKKVDLIVAHHPIIFKAVKSISKDDPKGRLLYQAIQNNVALYAAHTNIDVVIGGLNDQLALKLGLEETEILQVTNQQEYYKIVVFVPLGHEEEVANALASAGAGHIGNYSHCSFRSKGIGTFMALEGTNPFIGTKGNLEKVEEIRLETIIKKEDLSQALKGMIQTHPYEEVAYDIYPIINSQPVTGIGRVGTLEEPVKVSIMVDKIKTSLGIEKVKFSGDVNTHLKKVAIVNGSGADLIFDAIKAKCDCLITGDVKYHDAQIALDYGLNVIDIGHYESEVLFVQWMTEYLTVKSKEKGLNIEIIPSETDLNPFQLL
ncbi:Nif3-like dinuclear metal center hexameric protein [Alkaliphilus transvaalensis]|uniref:Nif3-like dinuclear metal center hexameric protein n=1 Tax=Alkaliphilus transvaalensis TaxID=114628 RepID=UPI00047C170B|nr:Nif3-like dinuclear metal center hexameric protein [Alkaliphilus transvaalensis]